MPHIESRRRGDDGGQEGACPRTLPPYALLFETLVNAVHEAAPTAKFAFNSNPADTAEAVQRAV